MTHRGHLAFTPSAALHPRAPFWHLTGSRNNSNETIMPAAPLPLPAAATVISLSAVFCVAAWAWLGASVGMPAAPLAGDGKLDCVSYTPFQAADSPFDGTHPIPASLIAADVARLAPITHCLRTYSAAGHGIEEVAAAAQRLNLKVMQGAWISRDGTANAAELEAAAAIAKAHPGTVTSIIAGNEVLLRNEQTPEALVQLIERARALSGLPVTYADVWEFWLKNPSIANAVDFITIHILPFWEDEPVAANGAAQHVASIYARVAAAFPGKRVIIGEVGWPSAGRMRSVALPSSINQARVLHDVVSMARQNGITTNIIEAFDQPWKRKLEGTVGGHWGLLDADARLPKFSWGQPVSNHPQWHFQAAASATLATLVVIVSLIIARKRPAVAPPITWLDWAYTGVIASAGSVLALLSFETLAAGAFGATGIARALMLGLVALIAPFLAAGVAGGRRLPGFSEIIGPQSLRTRCPLSRAMGIALILTFLAAIQVALSLTFDPRYWEFPFAPLTGGALAFAVLVCQWRTESDDLATPHPAESFGAGVLAAAAAFIAVNEGLHNWQAVWLSAVLMILAAVLGRLSMVYGKEPAL